MKKIIILCTVLGLMVLNSGCTVRSAVDIQRPELKSKRKTKKINWSTREQMENLIGNPPGVFMVLFVDPEERQSMKSIELASRMTSEQRHQTLNWLRALCVTRLGWAGMSGRDGRRRC